MDEILHFFTQTGDGVWAVDEEQRIVLWTPVAEELFGHAAEEVLGRRCYEVVAGRDAQGNPFCRVHCSVMERARQGERIRAFDLLIRRRDGTLHPVNVSIVAVYPEPAAVSSPVLVHLARPLQAQPASPPPLRMHFLGPTLVQRADGTTVGGPLWRRAKVRALLAFLALKGGRPVHRDALIEAFWPSLEYSAALHNLNTTVYNLRRSLEPELRRGADSQYIRYDQDCYWLSGAAVHWLDAEAFESGIAAARREQDPLRAMQHYQEALALYRGDFLADLLGQDIHWCWMERERLRELHLTAMEELGALYEGQRQEREATEWYLRVLSLDPCRETACRRLMRLAMRRGDRAAAIAHYRRLADALRRELDVVPSQETRLLYEVALRGG